MQENLDANHEHNHLQARELATARTLGIYASIAMLVSILVDILFLVFQSHLPFEIIIAKKKIMDIITLIFSITMSVLLWFAFRKISDISGSDVFDKYKRSIICSIICVIAIVVGILLKDLLTLVFAIISIILGFYVFILWLKIHYKMAQITKNKLFSIYASACIGMILAIIGTVVITPFFKDTEIFLSVMAFASIAQIIIPLILAGLMLAAWIKIDRISRLAE